MQRKLLGTVNVDFDTTGQLLITYSEFVKQLRKWEISEAVHHLFIDFEKAYDSVRREVLYNIFIEFDISIKLERLINMCTTESYSRVRVGKYLSDMFPVKKGLKKRRCIIAIPYQRFVRVCH